MAMQTMFQANNQGYYHDSTSCRLETLSENNPQESVLTAANNDVTKTLLVKVGRLA